ncbi:hypothetical protein C8Q76DRAFT_715728 [Earliella scabrosa]|nr:hypothetical protein C8Q76DRAFT_715728 [Earliella scabrosa]
MVCFSRPSVQGDDVSYFPWGAFAALRAYSLSDRSSVWAVVMILLSLVPSGINLTKFFVAHLSGYNDVVLGCITIIDVTGDEVARDVILSRTSLIVADVILIGLTLSSVPWNDIRLRQLTKRETLQSVLLYDGAIYFVLLLALNTLHLIFTLLSIFGGGNDGSNITIFTEPFTAVLNNRFLLHLQEAGTRTLRVASDDPLKFSVDSAHGVPSFVKFVGSIAYLATAEREPSFKGEALPTEDGLLDAAESVSSMRRAVPVLGTASV